MLDQEDPQNFTPFMRYALYSNFEMAKKLLNRGADIDYVNREGKTALVMAVQMLRIDSIHFLLEKGANPHLEDLTGQDACDYARSANLTSI